VDHGAQVRVQVDCKGSRLDVLVDQYRKLRAVRWGVVDASRGSQSEILRISNSGSDRQQKFSVKVIRRIR
jgi:hypothetical protein